MKSEEWRNASCCAMQDPVICHPLTSHAIEMSRGQRQQRRAEGKEEKGDITKRKAGKK